MDKKTHQNLSNDNYHFKKIFEVDKKQIFSSEKRNSGNCTLVMLTRSSERIFNPMLYTIYYYLYYSYDILLCSYFIARKNAFISLLTK